MFRSARGTDDSPLVFEVNGQSSLRSEDGGDRVFAPTDVTPRRFDRHFSLGLMSLLLVIAVACSSNTHPEEQQSAPVLPPPTSAAVVSEARPADQKANSPASVMKAVSAGDLGLLARLLDAPDANVNSVDPADDWTPLHAAAASGQLAVVSLLLSRGARVDAVTRTSRWTPLHTAAHFGREEIALTLVRNGADTLAKDSVGRYPGNVAAEAGYTSLGITIFSAGMLQVQRQMADTDCEAATKTTLVYEGTTQDGEFGVPESFGRLFVRGTINQAARGADLQVDVTSVAFFASLIGGGGYELSYVVTNVGARPISIERVDNVVYGAGSRLMLCVERYTPFRLAPFQDELFRLPIRNKGIPHQIVVRIRYADGDVGVFTIQGLARAVCERDLPPTFAEVEESRSLCLDSR